MGLDKYLPIHGEEDANDGDGDSCLPCDEENADVDDELDVEEPQYHGVWTRKRRPKAFSLLPIAKLRASMGYYGLTELRNMYSELRSLGKRGAKRKVDEDPQPPTPDNDPQAATLLPWSNDTDSEEFGVGLFDFSKIKGKRYTGKPEKDERGRGWRLANFRTNPGGCTMEECGAAIVLTCKGLERGGGDGREGGRPPMENMTICIKKNGACRASLCGRGARLC